MMMAVVVVVSALSLGMASKSNITVSGIVAMQQHQLHFILGDAVTTSKSPTPSPTYLYEVSAL